MSQHSENLIELRAQAADEATEVFIVDSRLRRIAGGVGAVVAEVPPGIYKVRFRSGDIQHDKLVEVVSDEPPTTVVAPHLRFSSAVPIRETETSRESHAVAAERISRSSPGDNGPASLFVFARDIEDEAAEPWKGISIHRMNGELLADLRDGEMNRDQAYAGISLPVEPGQYRIRVETGGLGMFEMFVTAAEGWQSQVFFMSIDFWHEGRKIRRASLNNAAVLMRRLREGFSHDDDQARLTELARQGLESGRNVVRASDLEEMLWAKYQNPMVAIFGAHLMLLEKPINHDLIETVMDNLELLIGPQPDVLALHLRPGAPKPPASLEFRHPPMLRSSWDLISRGSLRRNSLVPPDSATDRVAEYLLTNSPWLLHKVQAIEHSQRDRVSFSAAQRMIDDLLEHAGSDQGKFLVNAIEEQPDDFSPLEKSIASVTLRNLGLSDQAKSRSPSVSVGEVLRSLDAPAASIARSTENLMRKLQA